MITQYIYIYILSIDEEIQMVERVFASFSDTILNALIVI